MSDPKQALAALMERAAPHVLKAAREKKARLDADTAAARQRAAVAEENEENATPSYEGSSFSRDRAHDDYYAIRDWRERSRSSESEARQVMREREEAEANPVKNFIGLQFVGKSAVAARKKLEQKDAERRRALGAEIYRTEIAPERDPDAEMRKEGYARRDAEWAAEMAKAKAGYRPETKRESEDRALRELEADIARLKERLRGPVMAGAEARKR